MEKMGKWAEREENKDSGWARDEDSVKHESTMKMGMGIDNYSNPSCSIQDQSHTHYKMKTEVNVVEVGWFKKNINAKSSSN